MQGEHFIRPRVAPVGASGGNQHDARVFQVRNHGIENGQTLEIDPLHPVDGQHQALADGVFCHELSKGTRQRLAACFWSAGICPLHIRRQELGQRG